MYKNLFFVGLIVFQCGLANAQDTPGRERGEIKDAEFIIRKDRVLTLPKQPRVFEKTPALPSAQSQGNYTYQVRDFFLDLKPLITEAKPFQRPFESGRDRLFHNYAKIGYGNYQSPLAELYINNVESDYLNYGLFLKHQGFYEGPVDGKNSAEDHTNIRLDAAFFQEDIEFFGKLGYDRNKYHFYGYSPVLGLEILPDDIAQVFNTIYGNVGLRKIDRSQLLNYEASLSLRLFNDNYMAREHEVGIKARLGLKADDDRLRGGIDAEAFISSPSDTTYSGINRNYAKVFPYVAYNNEFFRIKAGANIIMENDALTDKNSDFHVFPSISAAYHLSESFGIYAEFEGDVLRKTYYDFVMENPYLGPSKELRNTVQKFQIDAGIQGSINDGLTYKTGIKFGEFNGMHFYGNHFTDSTRFQLIYDDVTQVLNYHFSLGWQYEDWYRLQASAGYFHYELSGISGQWGIVSPWGIVAPWHRPEWEIGLENRFMPDEKWLISAHANLLGGIQALNFQSGNRKDLKTIIDLSARADYSITPRFSVFAEGNNLLNQNYERYLNYRVRGIQGIAGLSFKF